MMLMHQQHQTAPSFNLPPSLQEYIRQTSPPSLAYQLGHFPQDREKTDIQKKNLLNYWTVDGRSLLPSPTNYCACSHKDSHLEGEEK